MFNRAFGFRVVNIRGAAIASLVTAGLALGLPFQPIPKAQAETISIAGAEGSPGDPGQPAQDGGNGSAGEDASPVAIAPTDPTNEARGTGGQGGDGGDGGAPPTDSETRGGDGGAGGSATSAAETTLDQTETQAESRAVGGAGGTGGLFGDPNGSPYDRTYGNGGRGGDGTATSSIVGQSEHRRSASAEALGGRGGDGTVGGRGGDANAVATAGLGKLGEHRNRITALGTGGRGGDAISRGSSRGRAGGDGGEATSFVDATGGAEGPEIRSTARGGSGGDGRELTNGGNGGDANASADVGITGLRELTVRATGGTGGEGDGPTFRGGDGGSATATFATSAPLRDGRSILIQVDGGQGGNGVDGAAGGDGAAAELRGDYEIRNQKEIILRQMANGGGGGQALRAGSSRVSGGSGGDALASFDLSLEVDVLLLVNRASGGSAGSGNNIDLLNRAGDATATTIGTNAAGEISGLAFADGGHGGNGSGIDGIATNGGDATAHTEASGAGLNGFARADARGGQGGLSERSNRVGTGGDARASAELIVSGGEGDARASASAYGGSGGSLYLVPLGAGGDGGEASAHADVVARGDKTSVSAEASAYGGMGGDSNLSLVGAGDGGDATATAHASHPGDAYRMSAAATARGGRGGTHSSLPGLVGAGGNATLINAVSADTPGTASLNQSATGGDGGTLASVDRFGIGGDATSELTYVHPSTGDLGLWIRAQGGASVREGRSGTTRIAADVTAAGRVGLSAYATAAGDAPLEIGDLIGRSSRGEEVRVSLTAEAANYGFEFRDDERHGRSISVHNQIHAETTGLHWLTQSARGARGESAGAPAASGGDAESVLIYDAGSSAGLITAFATGGDGMDADPSESSGSASNGGAATTHSEGQSRGESLEVRASSEGGEAGRRTAVGGDATSTAIARSQGSARHANADAWALGGGGEFDGDGGNARAHSELNADSALSAESVAWARGGQANSGGDGGNADANASLSVTGDGIYSVTATARARDGGLGGQASARAHGDAPNGELDISVTAINGHSLGADDSGTGHQGRSIEGINVASGNARVLRLEQRLQAGQGWHADTAGMSGGDGGTAVSVLEVANSQAEDLTLVSTASGARGGWGKGEGVQSGRGGDAFATASAANIAGHVSVEAHAVSGDGGFRYFQSEEPDEYFPRPAPEGARAGTAGSVSFGRVFGESLNGGDVRVAAIGAGGNGGTSDLYGGVGSDGASVLLSDLVEGRTSGMLELIQVARGGEGGFGGTLGGDGGDGGSAESNFTHKFAQEAVSIRLEAESGAGGYARLGEWGSGGRAVTLADVLQEGGDLTLVASATANGRRTSDPSAQVDLQGRVDGDGHRLVIGEAAAGKYGEEERLAGALGGPDARSQSVGIATGNSEVVVIDRAEGGNGIGDFLREFATPGGNASSYAEGRNAGSAPVLVRAIATGGRSGSAGDATPSSGGIATADAYGVSTGGGDVRVESIVTGGSPGGQNTGAANSFLTDAVRGATSGRLSLRQHAIGGGGQYSQTVEGGDARSVLHAVNPGGGALEAISEASGGNNLANAYAEVYGEDHFGMSVDVRAIATGGPVTKYGEMPGAADALAYGHSTAGAPVSVLARAAGGSSSRALVGRDVSIKDRVSGKTKGLLTLRQEAIGGSSARSATVETPRGGHARSVLNATNSLGGDLVVSSLAQGGDYLANAVPYTRFLGGDAFSQSSGRASDNASLSVQDQAIGGAGSSGGNAHSIAIGTSFNERELDVLSYAVGGEARWTDGQAGRVRSSATGTSWGGTSTIRARAEAGLHLTGEPETLFGIAALPRSTAVHASTVANGRKVATESRALGRSGRIGQREFLVEARANASGRGRLSTDAKTGYDTQSVFSDQTLASAVVSGAHERDGEWIRAGLSLKPGQSGPDIMLESEVRLRADSSAPLSDALFISFLDFELTGEILDDLQFEIRSGEEIVRSEKFYDAKSATAFFRSVISLGPLASLTTESGLDLRFLLSGRSTQQGIGIATRFVIGTRVVPEPGSAILLAFGLSLLSAKRRS